MNAPTVTVPLRLEGVVTVECEEPDRGVVHREVVRNLITDDGIQALKFSPVSDLLDVCILGRNGAAAAAGDLLIPGYLDFWSPACGNALTDCYIIPGPQDRSVVAVSQDNGSFADEFAYTGGSTPYWSLTRHRVFRREAAYFPLAELPDGSDDPQGFSPDWYAAGWANLAVEASYIKEVSFCAVGAAAPDVRIQTSNNCTSGGGPVNAPIWSASSQLWNRVVLAQSIGWGLDEGEVNVTYPWQGNTPDVVLSAQAIVRVKYELRVYMATAETVQTIDVDGVSTTCRTRVIDIDNATRWGSGGAADQFGNWVTALSAAEIAESAALPASLTDPFSPPGRENADSVTKVTTAEDGEQVMTFGFGATKGLFSGGIGSLLHGNFGPGPCFATVFDPPISKSDLQSIDLSVRYAWSRI